MKTEKVAMVSIQQDVSRNSLATNSTFVKTGDDDDDDDDYDNVDHDDDYCDDDYDDDDDDDDVSRNSFAAYSCQNSA